MLDAGATSDDGERCAVSEEAPSDATDADAAAADDSGAAGADGGAQRAEQPAEDAAERAERIVTEDEILEQAASLEKIRSAKVRHSALGSQGLLACADSHEDS